MLEVFTSVKDTLIRTSVISKEEMMEILTKIDQIIEQNDQQEINELFEENYSVDIANVLEDLNDQQLEALIALLNPEQLALIIEESQWKMQHAILQLLSDQTIIEVFKYMDPDDIADVLGETKIVRRKALLGGMNSPDAYNIRALLKYAEDTAGGIMTTQYISLRETMTVADALVKIKLIGPKTEVIETIFTMNDEYRLTGKVDLRDILTNTDDTKLIEILDSDVISVRPEMDQEEVALLVSKYDLKVVPVVNNKGALLGIITVDDIIDVIVDEQTEDLLMISGVDKDEKIDNTVLESLKSRLPWLLINLITAFVASATVGAFEDVINQVVALAAAMTIITGMGGNAGSQTLSVMIRSIALGKVNFKEDWKLVIKEVLLGLIDGAVTGFIAGLVLYFRYHNIWLGVIIILGMICNLMIAGFFGFLIPLILKKLNFDPAISSSIFLTTATDVGGFFVFLGLAKIFLPLLL